MLLLATFAGDARAQIAYTESLPGGVERTTYRIGPLNITPGQNRISYKPITGSERPNVNGWITRIKPDLVREDGSIPKSSLVMFHHGVWINQGTGELFFATGEEKTIFDIPEGFGYRYRTDEGWMLNHMIHNLVTEPMTLYAEYTVDFIPNTAPEAADITRARPIWMDVESGIYPVFDVFRDSGGADGEIAYPEDFPNAYPPGVHKNRNTLGQGGVLLGTTGHVHTGGLSTNLYLRRNGATYAGPSCPDRISYDSQLKPLQTKDSNYASQIKRIKKRNAKLTRSQKKIQRTLKKRKHKAKAKAKRSIRKLKRKKKANTRTIARVNRLKATNKKELNRVRSLDETEKSRDAACRATQPKVDDGNRVHLFNSKAEYFDPKGPISWDMAMFSTDKDWRVRVEAGDTLELQTTYETEIASWPESMGINVVFWARDSDFPDAKNAPNPYETKVDTEGVLNHGHLPENEDYGGENSGWADPTKLPDGAVFSSPFMIGPNYQYNGADFRLPGAAGRPPVVNQGESFEFTMHPTDINNEVWHSLTSCKAPCNGTTGISHPIPDGDFQFESGQMGPGLPPTVGWTTWKTPPDLPKGTHTFFCRIHPLMRGAIRVK